uniref:Uncharacterized protein n=1 Tax=Anopheles atroparvus TaxID=41427 RepID=A0AAG5D4F9_ANOAO
MNSDNIYKHPKQNRKEQNVLAVYLLHLAFHSSRFVVAAMAHVENIITIPAAAARHTDGFSCTDICLSHSILLPLYRPA